TELASAEGLVLEGVAVGDAALDEDTAVLHARGGGAVGFERGEALDGADGLAAEAFGVGGLLLGESGVPGRVGRDREQAVAAGVQARSGKKIERAKVEIWLLCRGGIVGER